MTIEQMKERLSALERELYAYRHATAVLCFDGETVAPRKGTEARGLTLGVLSEKTYQLQTAPETCDLLKELLSRKDELPFPLRREAELLWEETEKLLLVPREEYVAYTVLENQAASVWIESKRTNDYALFRPWLEKMLKASVRMASLTSPGKAPYDALLDKFEKGITTAELDPLFRRLREEIAPLMEEVKAQPPRPAFVDRAVPAEDQRRLAYRIMDRMGLTPDRCILGEVEHPFTEGINRNDVRITTHYYENTFLSNMFTILHEGGHALYELNLPEAYAYTALSAGVSSGFHESQSRFCENMIGHHPLYLKSLSPVLRECVPHAMEGVSDGELLLAANYIAPSPIRTDADQVTYPLHIMIRYELEKLLVDGSLSVNDLPGEWNRMYKDYLGLEIRSDREGVLQDMHWANGLIGYFPTYTLGSAYAAQFWHAMEKDMDPASFLEKGDMSPLTGWLAEKIQSKGLLYPSRELLLQATGEPFNPEYYIRHLRDFTRTQCDGR